MAKVILIASGKGGTGKTTVTSALGVILARRGRSVIALDCDRLGGLDVAFGCGERSVYDLGDAVRGDCELSDCLAVLPLGEKKRGTAGLLRYAKLGEVGGDKVPLVFKNLRKRCDFLLCDCPAGSVRTEFSGAADILLLVTNIGDSCNRAASAIRQELQTGREPLPLLVVNRVDRRVLRKQRVTLDDSIDGVGARLIGWTAELDNLQVTIGNWRRGDFDAFQNIAERLQNEV
ncbi:MAG: P-loop NTPase [Oscillospiraceae bacterium]|nr:P-loop NTPase [Oscillospiraceae bacterium]